MEHPDQDSPVSMWAWSLEQRLSYAMSRMEKCMEKYPRLAELWLAEVNTLEQKILEKKA